jgi:antitoxin VapB
MSVLIENPETDQLLGRLSALTGESCEEAVQQAVRERLERLVADDREAYITRIRAITSRIAALPVLDARTADEIIGYNEHGHFD